MPYDQRSISIARFLMDDSKILITTDLASRGLDFENVKTIIQYNFSKDILSLLHRFGRTARGGKEGHGKSYF